MSTTIDLALDGLSCGHCVKRVKESLEQRPDVEQAEVTVTEAHVTGSASAEALIETIKQAGYGAELSHPKAKPLAESSIPPEALTAATSELPAARDEDDSQQLLINGMSCASCVSRVQHALAAVPGVSQARVNLAERTALVMGSASAAELVQAVEKAGYGAEARRHALPGGGPPAHLQVVHHVFPSRRFDNRGRHGVPSAGKGLIFAGIIDKHL